MPDIYPLGRRAPRCERPGARGLEAIVETGDVHVLSPVRYLLHVGGERVAALSGREFTSENPTSGEPWASFPDADEHDVGRAVEAAARAFRDPSWRDLSATRRGRLLMRFGDRIAEHAEELAAVETRDNGKLLREMLAQARMVPEWLYYFGGLADKVEGSVIPLDRRSVLNYT